MAWSTPKTDWYGEVNVEGEYQGDRFNAVDYNRIKNNIDYLHDLSLEMYEPYTYTNMGNDKSPGDFFYADEIMNIEQAFTQLVANTFPRDYGTSPTYSANGNTMDFNELNRLESAILNFYNILTNQKQGLRHFTWNFGFRGVLQ